MDQAGYLCADETTRTNLPGVFAAGDVRTKPLRQVVTAAADGAAILRQQCYRRMVTNYRSVLHDDPMAMVRAGLERLAFGRTNDAVRLLLGEELPTAAEVAQLDLFPVSSIKRDKSGGMEIHFFDRLKALASLYEYSGDADSKAAAQTLLAALSGGEAVNGDGV